MDERTTAKHTVTIDKREKITASGITELFSFDEENIVADTDKGIMIIRGSNLHINNLNLDKGDISIDGAISSLSYEDENRGSDGFFKRLFK